MTFSVADSATPTSSAWGAVVNVSTICIFVPSFTITHRAYSTAATTGAWTRGSSRSSWCVPSRCWSSRCSRICGWNRVRTSGGLLRNISMSRYCTFWCGLPNVWVFFTLLCYNLQWRIIHRKIIRSFTIYTHARKQFFVILLSLIQSQSII